MPPDSVPEKVLNIDWIENASLVFVMLGAKSEKSGKVSFINFAMAVVVPVEETVIKCLALFYEEGKSGENFRKMNKF